jgi:hypothetical protein
VPNKSSADTESCGSCFSQEWHIGEIVMYDSKNGNVEIVMENEQLIVLSGSEMEVALVRVKQNVFC